MNIYMDLSFVLQIVLGYCSLYLVKSLLVIKVKRIYEVIFILFIGFSIYLIYLPYLLSLLIYFIYVSTFMLIISRKNYFKGMFLYLFCYLLLTFIIDKLSSYNKVYNFLLVIVDEKGMLSYLFGPLFLISLYLSIKLVDNLFHLHNYKTNCYLIKENKKVYYSCYYDTGNVLKIDDIPVIFISKGNYIFTLNGDKEIEIESLNKKEKVKVESCLLTLEDKKEYYFVYVCLTDKDNFNGCEILLNAYLM